MIRNIIFDWSGTLVDDLPAVWQATNHVLAKAGRPEITLDKFRAEFCLPFTKFYERHVSHVPMPQLEAWFHSRFREVQDSVVELPHARPFLEFCRKRGIRMFLLSTLHPDHFTTQSRINGFHEFLDRPYLGVADKRARIHEILAENNLNPLETLFIGDMQHDIDTARHGGIQSCAVLTGYNRLEQLRESQPDVIVEHLGELQRLLETHEMRLSSVNDLRPPASETRRPIATVGALIYNEAGEVLMIRTRKWSDLWGIPGGKIHYGEASVTALRRELKEETNLDVDSISFVLVQDCIHSKEFYREEHFLLLNYTCIVRGTPTVTLNSEAQEFQWLMPKTALELNLNQPTRTLLETILAGPAPRFS